MELAGFSTTERGKENEIVLGEQRPKGLEAMKKEGKLRRLEEMKGQDKQIKKERKIKLSKH
jgi:hypothetical protein